MGALDQMESVALVDHMARPSPERASLLREFFLNRFSRNYDAKQQGTRTKREKYFSAQALRIIRQVNPSCARGSLRAWPHDIRPARGVGRESLPRSDRENGTRATGQL